MTVQLARPIPAIDFPDIYEELLWRTLRSGHEEINHRTGAVVRVHPGGPASFAVDLSDGFIPLPGNRKVFPGTAAAETAWFLLGTQDPGFIMRQAPRVWEKFIEPGPKGEPVIASAYGYRWRKHFGRDQIVDAIRTLMTNGTDRRVYVSAWDPSADGLGRPNQLNVPCPVGFTFSIVDGQLCSAYLLRSSDIFVGLPYDVMGHALLMDIVANSLGIPLGTMHFTMAHPHLYGSHFEMARESLMGKKVKYGLQVPRPSWSLFDVECDPDGYVARVRREARGASWPDYCPQPEVVA